MEWLRHGELLWGNPSSHHSSGKKAKKLMREAEAFILSFFSLADSHTLFFHSGATEGINAIVQGFFRIANFGTNQRHRLIFNYSPTDHSAITEQTFFGSQVTRIPLLVENGVLKDDGGITAGDENELRLLNWTWVNNESGIVWPLEEALSFKQRHSNTFVHVDCAQIVGKVREYQKLLPEIDYYTFSGHKFGALKGIGLSFIKKGSPFSPLIVGGGQQLGRRSGTENLLGIASLKLALEEMHERLDYDELLRGKMWWESELKTLIGKNGRILGESAVHRNANTISLLFYPKKSDILLAALDLEGVEVSRGSACSLGQTTASSVLQATGCTADESKRVIRFSFSPLWKQDDFRASFDRVKNVLTRFIV